MDSSHEELRGVTVSGDPDGRPIVFVHGVTLTGSMWLPQVNRLPDDLRLISFDLPGHGARADETFQFERAVDLLDRVVEREADGEAVVVGLSLGGYLATSYASRYPDKVDALIISGSSANPTGLLGVLTRVVSAVSRAAAESRLVRKAYAGLWKRLIRRLHISPEEKHAIIDDGFYFERFGEAGRDLAGRDFRAEFSAYPGPALVLNGEADLLSRRGEDEHAAAAPDARVEVVDDAGHTANLHRPGAYTRSVEQFYREAFPEPAAGGDDA